jgi:phosphate-selective porin OprO/OprP
VLAPLTILLVLAQEPSAVAENPREPDPSAPTEVPAPEVTDEPDVTPEPPTVATPEPAPVTPPVEAKVEAGDPRFDPTPVKATRFVPGKGFETASKDGRFALQIRARAQIRYELLHPNVAGESTEQVMMLRRLRLQFQGNVFGKHNRYYIQFGFTDPDMSNAVLADEEGEIKKNPIRDARVEFDYVRDFTVWAGQMKIPFSRQRVNSSGNLNMVDRSIVNEEFQLDRDIGVQVLSKDIGGKGWFAYQAGVFMGEGRNNWDHSDLGMLYVARFEITPLGKFEDYSEGDVERTPTPKLALGTAYAYQDRGKGTHGVWGPRWADGGTADFHNLGADAIFKFRGLSLNTAFQWRKIVNRKGGGAVDDEGNLVPIEIGRSGLGWLGQLGYLVPKVDFEVVARYALVRDVFGDASSLPSRDEAGLAVNYYFAGHNLKLQLDYFRLWDDSMGTDWADAAKHGTDRVRLQLQLAF